MYYRTLESINDEEIVSSVELAGLSDSTAAQVRRDLHYFGHFGVPGKGYIAGQLREQLQKILGLDRTWRLALIGTGKIGKALLMEQSLKMRGFRFVCAFDNDPEKIGQLIAGLTVHNICELEAQLIHFNTDIALVAVPEDAALSVITRITDAGIRGILNLTSCRPSIPSETFLVNIDFCLEFEKLSYFLQRSDLASPFFSKGL